MTDPGARPEPERVVAMFDRIAPWYDAMNTLITAGIDRRWRRDAIHAARPSPGMRLLDVATGTGKLAAAAARAIGRGGEVIGLDPSGPMLARARSLRVRDEDARLTWVQADGMALPFSSGTFDAVTIGFGLRNLPDAAAGLREMVRVLAPGGRVVVLEIAEPRGGPARLLFSTWFRRVVPWLGRLAGRGDAYAYLPRSLDRYPPPPRVAQLMADAGLVEVRWRWLTTRLVTLHVGIRDDGPA
jgi:demethylmenaquinone methyltransferase/2-methoxy-6-polyprenyl-1,4-benzoquinol methylase